MFDLEKSIADWRRQLLAAGIKTPVPLEELESHLRDEIEQRRKWGRSEAEAFTTAVQKIGQAHLVQSEFEKVEETKKAREQKLMEILMVVAMSFIPLFLGSMVLFKKGSFSEMTSAEQMSSLAAAAAFSLLAWGGRLSYGMFPVIRAKRIRNVISISGGVLVALWLIVFLNIIVPRYDFTMGQFGVTLLWACFAPGGALTGLSWGIETAARKKVAMAGS
jgi:hypothetical protein